VLTMTRRLLLVGCIVLFAATMASAGTRKLKLVKGVNGDPVSGLSSGKTQYFLKGAVINQSYQVITTKGLGDAVVATTSSGDWSFGGNTITASPDFIPVTGIAGSIGGYSIDVGSGKYKANKGTVVLTITGAATTSLKAKYAVDIGIAAKWNTKPDKTPGFPGAAGKKTVLSAVVAPGAKAVGLSSRPAPAKTLVMNTTAVDKAVSIDAKGKLVPNALGKALYGAVGSEAEIRDSSAITAGTTVSMEWRARTGKEAHAYLKGTGLQSDPDLADGADWLTSDVVKITGLDSTVSYALQMSFDNRINMSFDGTTKGTVPNELAGLYIAQRDAAPGTDSGLWKNAARMGAIGAHAQERVSMSLANFLTANSSYTLAQLQGSWGVDPASADQGTGHSWAIVAGGGSGIFAVVPEPSTLVLIGISAGIGAMAYGLRRRKAKIVG
jgi:hypothetical protein